MCNSVLYVMLQLWSPKQFQERKALKKRKRDKGLIKAGKKPTKEEPVDEPCPSCDTYMFEGQRYFYLCDKHRTEREALDGISCIRPRESVGSSEAGSDEDRADSGVKEEVEHRERLSPSSNHRGSSLRNGADDSEVMIQMILI